MSARLEGAPGFTLFEVLVVLAIIGLVTAVVAPVLFRGLAGTEARTVAYEIAAALRQARGDAVAQNVDVAVVFDLSANAYAVERSRPRAVPEGVAIELLRRDEPTRGRHVAGNLDVLVGRGAEAFREGVVMPAD